MTKYLTNIYSCVIFVSSTTQNTQTMTNVQNIINATNPSAIVLGKNTVKAIYGKRQVVVSYNESTDLFSVWAFTLSGVKFSKEVKFDGVFVDNLKQTINEAI